VRPAGAGGPWRRASLHPTSYPRRSPASPAGRAPGTPPARTDAQRRRGGLPPRPPPAVTPARLPRGGRVRWYGRRRTARAGRSGRG
jgi:hypothetical protein